MASSQEASHPSSGLRRMSSNTSATISRNHPKGSTNSSRRSSMHAVGTDRRCCRRRVVTRVGRADLGLVFDEGQRELRGNCCKLGEREYWTKSRLDCLTCGVAGPQAAGAASTPRGRPRHARRSDPRLRVRIRCFGPPRNGPSTLPRAFHLRERARGRAHEGEVPWLFRSGGSLERLRLIVVAGEQHARLGMHAPLRMEAGWPPPCAGIGGCAASRLNRLRVGANAALRRLAIEPEFATHAP